MHRRPDDRSRPRSVAVSATDEPRILPIGTPVAGPAAEPRWVSPRELLEEVVSEVRERHERHGHRDLQGRRLPQLRIEIDVPEGHGLHADPAALRRILGILVDQAVEAATRACDLRGAPPVCEVVVTSIDAADAIEIEVADSGPGLPVRSGARGVAADDAGPEATAVVPLAERLGGTLHATNCPEGGTARTLRLPHRRPRRAAA